MEFHNFINGFESEHHVFEFPSPPQIHLPQIKKMWQMMEIYVANICGKFEDVAN